MGNQIKVTFLASFPPIQSAIKVGQDGMRLQLYVPETEMVNAVELLALRNVVFKVTVEAEQREEQGQEEDGGRTVIRTKAKRRVVEGDTGVQ